MLQPLIKKTFYPFGDNWLKRAEATVALIKNRKIDVVGIQELTPKVKQYFEKQLEDYIFISENLVALKPEIIKEKYNGVYPSDHFPISVKIKNIKK